MTEASGSDVGQVKAPRDPRVDKFMSWGLATLTVLALAAGGWLWKDAAAAQRSMGETLGEKIEKVGTDLGEGMKELRGELGAVKIDVATLQENRKRFDEVLAEQSELRARLRTVEAALAKRND